MLSSRVQWFLSKNQDIGMAIFQMRNPKEATNAILKALGPDLQKLLKAEHFNLIPQNREELLENVNTLIELLRKAKQYDEAERQMEMALYKEFKQFSNAEKFDQIVKEKAMTDATDNVDKHWGKTKDQYKAQGMNEEQMAAIRSELISINYERNIRRAAARDYNFSLSGRQLRLYSSLAKGKIFDQYCDMLDPKGETLNATDENWDTFMEIVCRDLPLSLIAGVAGWGFGAILSAGLKKFVSAFGERLLVRLAATQATRSVVSIASREGIRAGTRFFVEETVGNVLFRVLEDGWEQGMPHFASDMMRSCLVFGFIGVGGVAARKMFGKGALPEASLALIRQEAQYVSNKPLQKAIDRLVATGNEHVAAFLLSMAAQNGFYNGAKRRALREVAEYAVDILNDMTKLEHEV